MGFPAPVGSELVGYDTFTIHTSPSFSWNCHSRSMRWYHVGASVVEKVPVEVPLFHQMRARLLLAIDVPSLFTITSPELLMLCDLS